jgi:hypothetical protein
MKLGSTNMSRRIGPGVGVVSLLAACIFAVLILVFAPVFGLPIQTLALLASMVFLFYAGHPMGHAIFARWYGVHVDYFYLGRTSFRHLVPVARRLPTVGTHLNAAQLAILDPGKRGLIFGAGVITSCLLMALEVAFVLTTGFLFPAKALVVALFAFVLATEALYSTKAGDLHKMALQGTMKPARN